MKLVTFFRRLRKLKDKGFQFIVRIDGTIRLDKDNYIFCPITAVYYDKTREYYPTGAAHYAGIKLSLSDTDKYDIIDAADNNKDQNPGLRKRLINAAND